MLSRPDTGALLPTSTGPLLPNGLEDSAWPGSVSAYGSGVGESTRESPRENRGGPVGMIHIDIFATLDGVGQAPGKTDEDLDGGFEFGGWQASLFDGVIGREVAAGLAGLDALLLGRRTYDIFAAYWPHQDSGPDAELARMFNAVPKYVASRSQPALEWAHSSLLGPDLAESVREIRERHANTHVIGSLNFVQTLLAQRLFDRFTLWVFPIILGQGKKVFADGTPPASLALIEPPVASTTGAVLLRYALTENRPTQGDMAMVDRAG